MPLLGVAELDRDVFTWVVEHRAAPFDWLFVALSAAGQAGLIWIVLAPLLALWARKPVLFTTLVTAATVWTADLLAVAQGRLRPGAPLRGRSPRPTLSCAGTWAGSLPSGHAATSAAGAVILAYLLGRGGLWLALLAVAIGFSRVYVGVHYPLDVLAGAADRPRVGLAAIASSGVFGRLQEARPRSGAARPEG